MKRSIQLVCLVTLITVFQVQKGHSFIRKKKQTDDRWEWGYVDTPLTREATTENSFTPQIPDSKTNLTQKLPLDKSQKDEEDDPCAKYEPVKPDFRNEDRFQRYKNKRISEIKCYEYIWEIKKRHDLRERVKRCQAKLQISKTFVIGGLATAVGDYPHMAAIGWKGLDTPWVFKCGGSLISESFVLTAAHCVNAPLDTRTNDPMPKIVRLGQKSLLEYGPQDVNIKRMIKHPRYAPPKKYFDIALLELESKITFYKTAQAACLFVNEDLGPLGTKVQVTGWGVKEEKSSEGSTELQVATVDLIDSQACDNYLSRYRNRQWDGLADHQMCAGKLTGGIDVCQGDSGGPLQIEIELPIKDEGRLHYIVGVTSFGKGCARVETPGIYTKVSSFIDWIEQHVWPNNE